MVGVEPRYLPPTPCRLSISVCFGFNLCGVCRRSGINMSSVYVYMYDVCPVYFYICTTYVVALVKHVLSISVYVRCMYREASEAAVMDDTCIYPPPNVSSLYLCVFALISVVYVLALV